VPQILRTMQYNGHQINQIPSQHKFAKYGCSNTRHRNKLKFDGEGQLTLQKTAEKEGEEKDGQRIEKK